MISLWLLVPYTAYTYQDVSVFLTWATVGGQVAIAVPTACCTAIDGTVIVIVARIRPRVCQPRLCSRFADVEKSWPKEKTILNKCYINSKYFLFGIPKNSSFHDSYK